MRENNLDWTGDPLTYKRKNGYGLVLRTKHYRFSADGLLEEVSPVTRPVLDLLLEEMYPNPAMARAAKLKVKGGEENE